MRVAYTAAAVSERFDVAILGGGSGGYVAAIRAGQLGLHTVVIEADKVGGTCLHRGCIPTKALLQCASLLDGLRHGSRLGVIASGVDFDFTVASKYRDDVVSQLHKGVEFLLKKNKVLTLSGRGRLVGNGQIEISGSDGPGSVDAANIILATGSRPKLLPGVNVDPRHVLTSDEALRLGHIPRSAIVLGAGAVGVEFASLWRSCGAEVTLVEMMDRLVPLEDGAIGDELAKQFEGRGIRCLTGTKLDLSSIKVGDGGVTLKVTSGSKEESLSAEVLLIATGRAANIENLGIENTGVQTGSGFVTVDGQQRTGEANIFAVGDMVGGFQLAHKAMHEGVIASEAIAGLDPHPLEGNLVTRTTYCTPQIASLGLSEEQARAAGHDVTTGVMPLRGNARAVVWGETGGFCKVVADASGTTLGVHIIGHEVTELIYGPALGALLEATPWEMGRAVAPHPTLSEVIGEAALAVSGQAIHI